MKWSVEFLNAEVEGEFLALQKDMQARFIRISELIQEHGLGAVGMPHVRQVEGKLWELRARGKAGISRGLYVGVSGGRVVVLRIFVKKTQKTPQSEILLAFERMKEL